MLRRYWQSLKADKETRQLTWVVIAWIVIRELLVCNITVAQNFQIMG